MSVYDSNKSSPYNVDTTIDYMESRCKAQDFTNHVDYSASVQLAALRAENERLTVAVNHAELAKLTKDDIINVLRDDIKDRAADAARLAEENERLTNALNMLRTSITQAPGMKRQEDNWMLGIIDTALGDGPATDRPHPLAPVEVD